MSAHTPGQWVANQHPYGAKPWTVSSPGYTPYVAASISRESDARLIAASPDLLAALKLFLAATAGKSAPKYEYQRACASAIIAQVEGRS